MLMVLFRLDEDRYAVDARCIVEIVPLVEFKSVPHAPDFVAGLFNYHGAVVPVLDLCRLMRQRTARQLLSSRIMLIDYERLCGLPAGEGPRILGLLAEHVTEAREFDQGTVPSPVKTPDAPYLDGIFVHDGAMSQCLKPAELLPAKLQELLFAACAQQTSAAPGGG